MKNSRFPVGFTTLAVLAFTLLSQFNVPMYLMWGGGFAGPFLVAWMVYKVLKDGVPSTREFNEHFYDDHEYRRNID